MSTAVLLVLLACVCGYALSLMRRRRRLEAEIDELRSGRVDLQTLFGGPEAFREELQLEILRIARTGRPATLIVLRIEDDPADDAEREARYTDLVRVLNATLRAIDRRYRIGADEFALLLPESRARGGLAAARRVDRQLQLAGAGRITAGVAELGPGIDRQLVFRHAYSAFLSAGQNDRSTILAYSPELELNAQSGMKLDGVPDIEPA